MYLVCLTVINLLYSINPPCWWTLWGCRERKVRESGGGEGRWSRGGEGGEEKRGDFEFSNSFFPPGLLGSVLPEDPQLLLSIHAASSVTHMWTTAAHRPNQSLSISPKLYYILSTRQPYFIGLVDRSLRGARGRGSSSVDESNKILKEGFHLFDFKSVIINWTLYTCIYIEDFLRDENHPVH